MEYIRLYAKHKHDKVFPNTTTCNGAYFRWCSICGQCPDLSFQVAGAAGVGRDYVCLHTDGLCGWSAARHFGRIPRVAGARGTWAGLGQRLYDCVAHIIRGAGGEVRMGLCTSVDDMDSTGMQQCAGRLFIEYIL